MSTGESPRFTPTRQSSSRSQPGVQRPSGLASPILSTASTTESGRNTHSASYRRSSTPSTDSCLTRFPVSCLVRNAPLDLRPEPRPACVTACSPGSQALRVLTPIASSVPLLLHGLGHVMNSITLWQQPPPFTEDLVRQALSWRSRFNPYHDRMR